MAESMPFLAETFARQLLNENSDLTALEDVLVAAKTLAEALSAVAAMKPSDVWTVPRRFCSSRSFQSIVYTPCQCITRTKGYLRNAVIFRCLSGMQSGVDV